MKMVIFKVMLVTTIIIFINVVYLSVIKYNKDKNTNWIVYTVGDVLFDKSIMESIETYTFGCIVDNYYVQEYSDEVIALGHEPDDNSIVVAKEYCEVKVIGDTNASIKDNCSYDDLEVNLEIGNMMLQVGGILKDRTIDTTIYEYFAGKLTDDYTKVLASTNTINTICDKTNTYTKIEFKDEKYLNNYIKNNTNNKTFIRKDDEK